jgi:hypothetical protein
VLVPASKKGGVILDATAACNPVYDLFEGAMVSTPPPGTRHYRNVTMHVSKGHSVGKNDMRQKGKELSLALVADLDERFALDAIPRKVLVVTHKCINPILKTCQPVNFTMSMAHWGAVDGSNAWKDHDTVVIFGLPYKPKRWAPSLIMAMQGVQDSAWLHDPSLRGFKHHTDIRRAIDLGQMVADILQAVNRVHCRTVIDDGGNCPKTDIFIMLPTTTEADSILAGIEREMPGMLVDTWDYCHQKQGKRGRKVNRGNFDASLVVYLGGLKVGDRLAASTVRGELSIPATTWDRIASRLKAVDPADLLCIEMQRLGVRYQVEKRTASFIKDTI